MVERIRALAIPPGWEEVWICADPLGHIQATGWTPAGRKQYRYHDLWRERRDRQKFDAMSTSPARSRSCARESSETSASGAISRERVLACAVRLLDRGFFRIGSEDYAEENETYGLATMRKRHVTVEGEHGHLRLRGEGRQAPRAGVGDRSIAGLVKTLRAPARRAETARLSERERAGGTSGPPRSTTTSRRRSGRTQRQGLQDLERDGARRRGASRLGAGAGSGDEGLARRRAKRDAVKQVAHYLGNTPAVCRASYIDPRVFDRFDGGLTVGGVFERLPEDPADWPQVQGPIEKAVLDLIDRRDSPAIERVD